MSDRLHAAEMPRLHAFDEEFEEDVEAVVGGRRRKIIRRLLMLAVVVLGAGAIAALALAWSAADGRLRLEFQSTAPSPRTVAREAAEEKVDRLRRQMDALGAHASAAAGRRHHLSLAGGCAGSAQACRAAGVLVLESGGIECDYRKPAGAGRSGVG